ncbi:MAG TPA: hypothetical protein VGK10_15860 [Prolixibacteraceae bacterium]|jgi:hypothetical protein
MEDTIPIQWYSTYNEIIGKAQKIQPYFAADLALFNDFDRWYTPAVNTELLSGINLGQQYFSETQLLGEIKRVTDLLDITFSAAIQYYDELNHYVKLGLHDTALRDETFGNAGFETARHSIKTMIALLNQAHAVISQPGIQLLLLAAYMPAAFADELAGLIHEMSALYRELKNLKRQHLLATRERIDLFNSLWDTMSEICDDAQIIFANHPERLENYDLYDAENWHVDQVEFIHLN